ncbi:hypothetical protein F511_23460 [Dorcoceras hygrometricum]|uniref:Pheophorbide a oxygenase domain-containing protein n=1 Tax=Dorcoceras hygrometricum TaxID=472368 RepID=A0A2Z7BXF6_9LAMI|nr:hypothetical protein F511_23460 [Dorcoceras hygrometricum]
MAVSFASATPIFGVSSNASSNSPHHQSVLLPFISKTIASPKRGKLLKTPIHVASPTLAPATIPEDGAEDAEPLIETADSEENASSKFSWRDHWYPVSLVEDLDPRYPTPFQLLNRDLVIWFDKSAAQLPDDFDKPEFSSVTIQRDLYYGYDTLMENVSDPSHIDFAHHKVTGRRDRAKPLPFKMQSTGPWGFSGANEGNPRISTKFVAPCYYINKVEIDTKLPVLGDQKWVIWICSFNVPMAPGKTRSIVCSARNFFQVTMPGPKWWQVVPRWYEHWTSNKVYDGDMIVLQGQEKIFLSKSKDGVGDVNKEYTKLTFTPTQADRFVLAFRNWLRRHGNSQPEWFGATNDQQTLPSITLSKRQMMDRFEQHTLKCSSCRSAHSSFQSLQKFLIGAAIVCGATAGVPPDMQIRIALGALAILSAGLAYAVNGLQKNFVFVDYVHADID